MANPNETSDEWAHRVSNEFFAYPNPIPGPSHERVDRNLPLNPSETYQPTGYQSSYLGSQSSYSSGHEITEEPPTGPSFGQPSSVAETEIEPEGGNTPQAKKAKKTVVPRYDASWWRFFEQSKDEKGTLISARCKVRNCKTTMNYVKANGLSGFKKHADKHIRKGEEPQDQPDHNLVQTLMNPDGTRTHQRYDEQRMLSELTRYIAQKERPITMGSCMSFARLIIRGCGQPLYKRFNHRKIVKEISRQFLERKNELIGIFGYASNKVSITSDIWTAGKHGLSYCCITAHYIDENWNLQKRVLSFRNMDYPHTAQVIFTSIIGVLEEYNLKRDLSNKVFSISFDNASNNIKSIEHFTNSLRPIMNGALFHQKCACHILNLTVKAGLKTKVVDDLIVKFKNTLHHIYSNNIRKQEFHALCERLGLSKLHVPWDVDTRWNSTYRMFHRCIPYRNAISESLSKSVEGLQLALTDAEWEQLIQLTNFLKVFFDATVALSCSHKPSAHLLLHYLYKIAKTYAEMRDKEYLYPTFTPIVEAMREKFLKYWEDVPAVTILANCVHPAYKNKYTIVLLRKYYEFLELPAHRVEAQVTNLLESMYAIYSARRCEDQPIATTRTTRRTSSSSGLLSELRAEGDLLQSEQFSTNELQGFLLGPYINDLDEDGNPQDVLNYWRTNATAYPTIAMMARDLLAVPVSTVPSESCFSSANRILTDKRTKLGPKRFEQLVCLKDWIDAEERMNPTIYVSQPSTSNLPTEESGTDRNSPEDDDSDGACDIQESDLWYMQRNY